MNEQLRLNTIPERNPRQIISGLPKLALLTGALFLASCTSPPPNQNRLGPTTPTIESTTPTGVLPIALPTDIGEILTRATHTPTETSIPASPTPTRRTVDLPSDIQGILGAPTPTPGMRDCREPIEGRTKPNLELQVYIDGVLVGTITSSPDGYYGFTFGNADSTGEHRVEVRLNEDTTIKVIKCTF